MRISSALFALLMVLVLATASCRLTNGLPATATPTPTTSPVATPTDPTLKILPSLVEVTAESPEGISYGSGVIIDGSVGYVVTATHVIADAYEVGIQVTLRNGVSRRATWIYDAAGADISVLSIGPVSFPPLSFGYQASVGEGLFAIGADSGSYTTAYGIVRAVEQDNAGWTMVTFDAPVEPGMSGGAVVNQSGEAVGILSLGSSTDAEGVAIALKIEDVDTLKDRASYTTNQRLTATPNVTPTLTPEPKVWTTYVANTKGSFGRTYAYSIDYFDSWTVKRSGASMEDLFIGSFPFGTDGLTIEIGGAMPTTRLTEDAAYIAGVQRGAWFDYMAGLARVRVSPNGKPNYRLVESTWLMWQGHPAWRYEYLYDDNIIVDPRVQQSRWVKGLIVLAPLAQVGADSDDLLAALFGSGLYLYEVEISLDSNQRALHQKDFEKALESFKIAE